MGISLKTTKMLWGRAAGRCSICRINLFIDSSETDDGNLIGEMCHLVAEKPEGPRGDPNFPLESIDLHSNLILLCPNHHTEIDKNPIGYPVSKLQELKDNHEEWVRTNLPNFDSAKQRDDEIYADYIAEWATKCDLDNWKGWSSFVLGGGQPEISTWLDQQLFELREWLLVRIWPGRYPSLEAAFSNFRRVLQDFQESFRKHAKRPYKEAQFLITEKFYKIEEWDPERYHKLFEQYDAHVDLLEDLMLELTRAGNLVCDETRKNIHHGFRLKEGRLAVMSGPHMDLSYRAFVPTYTKQQAEVGTPYPGLKNFLRVIATRDHFYSEPDEAPPE